MKILEIKENKGFYSTAEGLWNPVDKLTKEELLKLLEISFSQEITMDEFDEEKIGNQAHQIIYKSVYEKFNELIENKDRLKDESEQLYKSSIEQYKRDIKKKS